MTRFTLLLGSLLIASAANPLATAAGATKATDCHVGSYALSDGGTVDLAPSEGSSLRWRKPDGTSGVFALAGDNAGQSRLGWTGRPDGKHIDLGSCADDSIDFAGLRGKRIPLDVQDTRFVSGDVELNGRLVMPAGDRPVPVVVLLQGSEHDSAVTFDSLQRRLPAQGIGAFVFDKRGTGASGGRYTQDFERLAHDAVAALAEARRLGGARVARIGYLGPSQGGWVAPMAARLAPVDFVIVSFGLAVSVIEEDRSAVALNMADKHYSPEITAKALDLVDAVDALAMNPTPEVFDRFAAVRDRFRGEPWFKDVRGDFAWAILPLKKEELAPLIAKVGISDTPWLYDPMVTISKVQAPQLWILGEKDRDAPSAETARRLALLRLAGRPISTAMFPFAEHGILEYESAPDGDRVSTRYSDGYFQLLVDFCRGSPLKSAYGTASLSIAREGTSGTGHF